MASIVNYVANGSTNQFQIPFTYINQADVVVTVNGATPTFTFLNPTTINIAATPASGAKVIIKRVTPLNALVDFTDGSTLFEADLDLAHQQNRLIAEESRDRADSAIATIDANITNIDTVAGIASNVTTVAGNTANVNSVANNMAEVLTADDNAATATTKAAEASSSATTASAQATISTTKASESSASAAASLASKNAAATSENNAATSETNAANSATASANSASASSSSATSASGSATTATTKAAEALTSANNAAVSATNSANSATTATTKASEASASQSAAAISETNALSSKNAAASSATNAATSETNSASSATASANSASTATTKANEAAASATAAATSATASANSATAAAASAASITGAETNAANSATAAASSATAASASKDAALAALDNFDDRYLGVKSSNPSVDNDGNALVAGSLYFNSTDDTMKVYEGSTWVAAYASLSGAVLQTGGTLTGDLSFGDSDKAKFGAGSDLRIYHDGNNSYIEDVGDGILSIDTNGSMIQLVSDGSGANGKMADFIKDGAVKLYYDNNLKLATTSTGIDVTGANNSVTTKIENTTGANYLQITNGTANGYFGTTGSNTVSMMSIGTHPLTFGVDGGAERMRIDSSGRVGIGTSSPSSELHVKASSGFAEAYVQGSNSSSGMYLFDQGTEAGLWKVDSGHLAFGTTNSERMRIDSSGNLLKRNNGNIEVGGFGNGTDYGVILTPADGSGYWHMYNDAGGHLAFGNSNTIGSTERMRIDSSGNLLVGTTTSTLYNATSGTGFSYRNGVALDIARENTSSAQPLLNLNLTGVDGSQILFYRDGSTVGSIFSGHGSTQLGIGTNTTGITFNPNTRSVMPANPSSQNPQLDATIDLGFSSVRWKDLYLSGTVTAGNGSASSPSFSFSSDTNTGIFRPNSDNLGFSVGGTQKAFISSTQFNVSTKIVATELDINGNADISGNVTVSGTVDGRDIATNIPSSLGTAGQVLTVNSGGNAGEWADAGGGLPEPVNWNSPQHNFTSGSSWSVPNSIGDDDWVTFYLVGGGGGGSRDGANGGGGTGGAAVIFNVKKKHLPSSITYSIGSGGYQYTDGGNSEITISGRTYRARGGERGTNSQTRNQREGYMSQMTTSGDMNLIGPPEAVVNGGAFYYTHDGYGNNYSYVNRHTGVNQNNSVFGGASGGSRINGTVRNAGTSTYGGNGGANGGTGTGANGSVPGGGGGGSHNPGGSESYGGGGSLRIYY